MQMLQQDFVTHGMVEDLVHRALMAENSHMLTAFQLFQLVNKEALEPVAHLLLGLAAIGGEILLLDMLPIRSAVLGGYSYASVVEDTVRLSTM